MNELQLQDGWKLITLGQLCKEKEGLRRGPFGSAIKKEFFVPDGYKVYEQSNAIYDDSKRGRYYIDENKYKELINFNVVPGDLIVSCSGTLGRIAEIPANAKPGVINQALLRIRLIDKTILKKYFLYYFRSASFQRKIFDQSQGTAMSNLIGIKDFKAIELSIPQLPEQNHIVDKIEELFSELDKGIENLKTAGQQLKVYRQAVLKWAFEGKLTNDNVKDGELPEGWEWVRLYTLADVNPKIPDKEGISNLLEIQFLPMKLVEAITGQVHLTETRKYGEVKKGYTPFINDDVIFAKVTPCMENGKIAVVSNLKNDIGFGSSEFHVIRSKGRIKSKYVFHFLIQERFRSEAANAMTGAVGLRRVPKQFIENYEIPLPPRDEQELIILEVESRLSVCDKMEETISTSLQQAEALRQSILKRAFEGKLVKKKSLSKIKLSYNRPKI